MAFKEIIHKFNMLTCNKQLCMYPFKDVTNLPLTYEKMRRSEEEKHEGGKEDHKKNRKKNVHCLTFVDPLPPPPLKRYVFN